MSPDSTGTQLRVAIIGSGPSGFYAAEHLQKQLPGILIDMYDRLPTPFGLVRGGVAPDHQKIKSVTKVYDRIASQPGFRFLGNVTVGQDLSRAELHDAYHAVIYAVGAQTDRALGIPGEQLAGSYAATEFVGWYNGHPDFRDCEFDLSQETAMVIGMGNVAVDVVRVLARTPAELESTDIAPYALEALRTSRVRNIYMLGRRGPVQGAFTNPELKELGEMEGADVVVRAEELELDPGSAKALESPDAREAVKNLQTLKTFAAAAPSGKPKQIHIRFLVSPVELKGNGRVEQIVLGHNRLVTGASGDLKAEPTGQTEVLDAGLVFRSVGYLGVGVPGVPFDQRKGIIPNDHGRVLSAPGSCCPGEYVVGWIKRGPSGVIGTNKPDSVETADLVLADYRSGALPEPCATPEQLLALLRERQVQAVSFADWKLIDQMECARGKELGRPRVKFCRVDEMLDAIRSARAGATR